MFVKFSENVFYEFQYTNFKVCKHRCLDILIYNLQKMHVCSPRCTSISVYMCVPCTFTTLQYIYIYVLSTLQYETIDTLSHMMILSLSWFYSIKITTIHIVTSQYFWIEHYLFNLTNSISNNILLSVWFWS